MASDLARSSFSLLQEISPNLLVKAQDRAKLESAYESMLAINLYDFQFYVFFFKGKQRKKNIE
jgi:hypothetical protein